MLAIFKREFKAYFTTPIGYIILAAFYFFSGLYFWAIYGSGIPQVEYVISQLLSVSVFLIPILTMRLMSEDRRQKVDQVLLTSPVKLTSIILGKYFAAFAVFAMCFIPTVVFEIIVMSYVSVNIFTFLYALLGILLLGGALISIGMLVSSLTESPVISAILTLVINITISYMSAIAQMINVEWISTAVSKLAFIDMFTNFGNEYFSLPDVIYFLSIIVAFLFLCVRALEKRRWS